MTRLLFLLIICLFSSCLSYKPVMITNISDVKTSNVEGDKVELSLSFDLSNPNRFRIVVKECDINVMLNDKLLGKAGSGEKLVIKGRSVQTCPFKLTANYGDFMAASVAGLGSFLKKEPVTFKIKGSIKGRIWWFRKNIPIETTQKIKL